jgi:hypothetical protein
MSRVSRPRALETRRRALGHAQRRLGSSRLSRLSRPFRLSRLLWPKDGLDARRDQPALALDGAVVDEQQRLAYPRSGDGASVPGDASLEASPDREVTWQLAPGAAVADRNADALADDVVGRACPVGLLAAPLASFGAGEALGP